jgi:hypothetical protein
VESVVNLAAVDTMMARYGTAGSGVYSALFAWEGEAFSTGSTAIAGNPIIQFGANDNQSYHTFRHVVSAGYDARTVQSAITSDINNIGVSIPQGQYSGTVVVNGTIFNYSAYKLPNGTINVGRITLPK